MTCSADIISTSSASTLSQSRAHLAADAVKGWWRSIWARRAQRVTVLMLRSLDEHTLRDIGLGRSEIELVVYGKPQERRRAYKPNWE